METTTKSMNSFDMIFETQSEATKELEKEHLENVKKAAGNEKQLEKEQRRFENALGNLANEILKRDSELRMALPFKLDKQVAKKLKENSNYYVGLGLMEAVSCSTACCVCGRQFKQNDVFLEDDRSAVACCIDECEEGQSVDGNHFRVKVIKK